MRWFFDLVANNQSARSLSTKARGRRHRLFSDLLLRSGNDPSILDVGGTPEYWRMLESSVGEIPSPTLLNARWVGPTDLHSLRADATRLPFRDSSFDFVFSNSVIEHLFSFERQKEMASEIRRVGRGYFVQTPNYWFPLEPHFLVPGFQFLPETVRVGLIRRLDLGWIRRRPELEDARRIVREHRLLTRRELRDLFPDARILTERFAGLPKSFIAVREPESGS